MRILTWHVHGNYLWSLAHVEHDWYLPVTGDDQPGYAGRTPSFPWPDNVHEVPVDEVADLDVDVVVYQSHRNWLVDRFEILTERQRELPQIFIEHDPPRESPTDTRHPVDDANLLLVHVTHFNRLMWDNGRTPTTVVEHGVIVPEDVEYTGELARGIVVVNNMALRGRRLGRDVFERVRERIPLDLVGIASEELNGLGSIPNLELPALEARYRFFFNPIRYTSLGLAVCEAMTIGMPVVGLATTEMVTAVHSGVNGFVDTDVGMLVTRMATLLDDRDLATLLGERARVIARTRFGIDRFRADWHRVLREVAHHTTVCT